MPQLPSGRKVAIDGTRLCEMAELNARTVQRYPIHRVKTGFEPRLDGIGLKVLWTPH